MAKQETVAVEKDPELDELIPRPKSAGERHMLSVSAADYAIISKLASTHKTTRGRIVTAIVRYYMDEGE